MSVQFQYKALVIGEPAGLAAPQNRSKSKGQEGLSICNLETQTSFGLSTPREPLIVCTREIIVQMFRVRLACARKMYNLHFIVDLALSQLTKQPS